MNDPDYKDEVEEYTFNPMRFVQAHLVTTAFSSSILAEYFHDTTLTTLGGSQYEPEIDHEWFDGRPPLIPETNNFSARWGGSGGSQVLPIPQSGFWYFYVTANDGFKLWLDGSLVLQDWTFRTVPATFRHGQFLSAGAHTVKLEYVEYTGNATIQLAW